MLNRVFEEFLVASLVLLYGSFFLWLQQALTNYRVF